MTVVLGWQDLLPFAPTITLEQADSLVTGTLARAAVYAPCLTSAGFTATQAASDLLRDVVLRRYRDMGGRLTQSTIGSVSLQYDAKTVDGVFTSSEVGELQQMCRNSGGVTVPSALPQYSMPDCAPAWPDPVERPAWWISRRTS